jgi:L-amino acid N-acyltransferase YncA
MSIRAARKEDFDQITKIANWYITNTVYVFDYDTITTNDMIHKWEGILSYNDPFIVCEKEDKILGYGYVTPYRTKIGYKFTREMTIYLDPVHKGKGIGGLIYQGIYQQCLQLGYRQMLFVIEASNTQSLAFFGKMGGVECGRCQSIGYKFDKWLTAVTLQVAIGEGDKCNPK